jgi:alpha-L-fucosidase
VKSPEQLFDLYLKSVGRGAALDLGIAPNPLGLLAEEDIASLKGFGKLVDASFKNNLATTATINSKETRGKNFGVQKLVDGSHNTYWASGDDFHTPVVEFSWKENIQFDLIRLREFIPLGQRIESFQVEVFENNQWKKIAEATSVGAARIIYLDNPVTAKKVRLRVNASPVCIALSEVGFYKKSDL